MYERTRTGLEEAQGQAREAGKMLMDINRKALRGYLRAAFQFQRAGLEALDALQRGSEELTFNLVDRAEEAQATMAREAELRLRDNAERLREIRETSGRTLRERTTQFQERLRTEQDEIEERGERTESRVRDGAEIALKVARVIETRIETMLTELIEMGRRELSEVEERIDALVDRLDSELEEEIHPIANYDARNADEVIAELGRLDSMQLRTVRAYEARNKNRVTVLRAIDEQLAREDEIVRAEERPEAIVDKAAETIVELGNPIAGYDEMNVEEVARALEGLDPARLGMARAYELASKNRVTVLREIDARLEEMAQPA